MRTFSDNSGSELRANIVTIKEDRRKHTITGREVEHTCPVISRQRSESMQCHAKRAFYKSEQYSYEAQQIVSAPKKRESN